MNHQDKINKIITQLEELWDLLPNTTNEEQTTKQELRAKIERLEQDEIKDLEALGNLGDTWLSEKSSWQSEKANLEQTIRDKDQALITQNKKLSEELVKKLDSLGLPEDKLTELKALLTSKSELKLSEEDSKKLANQIQPNNHWGIAASVLAGLAVLMTTIGLIFQKKENSKEQE